MGMNDLIGDAFDHQKTCPLEPFHKLKFSSKNFFFLFKNKKIPLSWTVMAFKKIYYNYKVVAVVYLLQLKKNISRNK